jgi:hypothetical protein
MVNVSEARTLWNLLKGVICLYKPAGITSYSVRKILLGNICRGKVFLTGFFRNLRDIIPTCDQFQTFFHRPLRIRKSAAKKSCFYTRESIIIVNCTCRPEFCRSSLSCWSEVPTGRYPLYMECPSWQKRFGGVWYVITLCYTIALLL